MEGARVMIHIGQTVGKITVSTGLRLTGHSQLACGFFRAGAENLGRVFWEVRASKAQLERHILAPTQQYSLKKEPVAQAQLSGQLESADGRM